MVCKATELKKKSTQDLSFMVSGMSQRKTSGIFPGYESDGFGNLGPTDSNSCTPKRKSISLNVDNFGGFDIPLQVISVGKMSGFERKELVARLRMELKQVQALQLRLSSREVATAVNGVASNGHAKKRAPARHNGPQARQGIVGRPVSVKQDPYAQFLKQCEELLKRLMAHKHGWVFNTPVDAVALKIPDYHTVIKHPMDLGTIKSKIVSGGYLDPWGFVADVRLTFTNAMTYNPPGNNAHIMADVMSKFFETRWKTIEKKLVAAESHFKQEPEAIKMMSQSKKRKNPFADHNVMPEKVKPKMTMEEKLSISSRLESLVAEVPDHIVDFLRRHSDNANQVQENEIEIDIDFLSDNTLFELQKLLDDYLREKQQAKADSCEVEILNESGLSNSSMHPCKGNEPADEDVDIGGNDLPISSYPPVEIEKDIAPKSSKCSSSSSSSSGSSSSSRDSESNSSSGSESNDRVASLAKAAKGSIGHEASLEQEKSGVMNLFDMNSTVNELDHSEHDPHDEPVSTESDGQQEGENAPSERQVSPDELYRRALLKRRFADTILRAREKTLGQHEKGDPEKLQQEREKLERHQRKERARLQAEAKAAEEALRRAKVEAEAELKRKRELEREAARQALLQMKKTIVINDNNLNFTDLEMLRTVPGEHLPSSLDETMSPGHLEDGLRGFSLGGSNPLEQLGLFMKEDNEEEEEEEEAEPSTIAANDVEEGEID